MLEHLSDLQIRDHCRSKIESLETWLRRLIDRTLLDAHGPSYFDYIDASGNRLFSKKISDDADQRMRGAPGRYPRKIDAILFDDAIAIVCNPELFKRYFRESVGEAYPGGNSVLRAMLDRLVDIRNRLAHANPVSLNDALRAACYCGDVVEAIRAYYVRKNMASEYNVPLILRVIDSFGGNFHREEFHSAHDGGIMMSFKEDPTRHLHPGDILTVEIEIDPSFEEAGYSIRWSSTKFVEDTGSRKIIVPITNLHVGAQWELQCRITTDKDWHRMNMGADDFLFLVYKVLPPQ